MNAGTFALVAALIVCFVSDAAPSGQITADPEVVFVPSGGQGSTLISWSTTNCANAQVTVQSAGGEEQTFVEATSWKNASAPWIGLNSYTFRLYGDLTRTLLLDSVEVIGTASPLTVQADGALRLDNRPFTGVGVNYYSAFERVLDKSSDTTYDAGFEELSRWGVPFARLDISGYWPVKLNLFFTNRVEYFRRLDGVVASAERHGVGLIPSLFWTTFAIPDLAGERHDQMAVSNSVTRQMMREFATEIVNRYKDSRAIWAWEFSNEWNLAVDIPNYTDFLPTRTDLGNPATRDPELDLVATDTILPAMVEIATLIKSLDPGRPISTGHAMSRPFQWHLDQWRRGLIPIDFVYNDDSPAQAEEIALRHCPDPFDLLSIHVYGTEPPRVGDFAGFAARAGKALFVGEFGTPPDSEANYAAMLTAVRTHSPLAAVWVFDRPKPRDEYNITITNSRSWMLRELLPATFESWSRGYGASEIPGDDQTAFGQYVFGAAFPGGAVPPSNGGMSDEFLELTAVVRTNDPSVSVYGQTADSLLLPEGWSSVGVQQADVSDQTDVLPGCVRRTYRVPVATGSGKFLRIKALSP
jgi:hypothetical protein